MIQTKKVLHTEVKAMISTRNVLFIYKKGIAYQGKSRDVNQKEAA